MLGSTLIDVVNTVLEETRNYIYDEMNLRRSVACVEIRGIVRNSRGRMKCGFSYNTMIATGKAEADEEYRSFLQDHLHKGHLDLIAENKIPDISWENSPIILRRIVRRYDRDKYDYSIAVAALGGTREENETIVNTIIDGIPEIG